jgi:hypothetical protein
MSTVDVQLVLERCEPAILLQLLDPFSEMLLTETDLDLIFLDCDGR